MCYLCCSGTGDVSVELNMKDLISGLQPLVLWMSNSIELLHFIQHEVPLLLTWRQQDKPAQDKGTA